MPDNIILYYTYVICSGLSVLYAIIGSMNHRLSLIPCTLTTMHSPNYTHPWPDISLLTFFTFPHALQQKRTCMHSSGRGFPHPIPTPHVTITHPPNYLQSSPTNFYPPTLHIYSSFYQWTLIPHLTASHPALPHNPLHLWSGIVNPSHLAEGFGTIASNF